MSKFLKTEYWIAIIGALVAIGVISGVISGDVPGLDAFPEQIIGVLAAIVAVSDTIKRMFTGDA